MKTAEELLALPDEDFRTIVEDDLREPGPIRDVLRGPQVIERLHSTMMSMLKSVEGQLAARSVDYDRVRLRNPQPHDFAQQRDKYMKWRAGSLRFKVGLEQALIEIRYLRDPQLNNAALLWAIEQAQATNNRLLAAIRQHRDSFDPKDDPSDNDEALWAHLPAE